MRRFDFSRLQNEIRESKKDLDELLAATLGLEDLLDEGGHPAAPIANAATKTPEAVVEHVENNGVDDSTKKQRGAEEMKLADAQRQVEEAKRVISFFLLKEQQDSKLTEALKSQRDMNQKLVSDNLQLKQLLNSVRARVLQAHAEESDNLTRQSRIQEENARYREILRGLNQ